MGIFKSLITDQEKRLRATARGLEVFEALAEKSKLTTLYMRLASPQLRTMPLKAKENNQILNSLKEIADKLRDTHIEKSEDYLAVGMTVGRGLKSHVHEFHSHYNPKTDQLRIASYDPESYVGRRHLFSPETSQALVAKVDFKTPQNITFNFIRLSAHGKAGDFIRRMHQIRAFDALENQDHIAKTPIYYYLKTDPKQSDNSQLLEASHHPFGKLNYSARQAQVLRTLKYISTLNSTSHLRPPDQTGQLYRHCEPGATCTPTRKMR